MTTLRDLGERGVIERLKKLLPTREDIRLGVGDDAAVAIVESYGFDSCSSPLTTSHQLPIQITFGLSLRRRTLLDLWFWMLV